jgi:hypothetical protein
MSDDPAFSRPVRRPPPNDEQRERDAERLLARSGDAQERGRAGLANVLMVLAGAILAGCVQLRSETADSASPLAGLRSIVMWTGWSLAAGLAVAFARFADAEAYRRTAINQVQSARGSRMPFNDRGWWNVFRVTSGATVWLLLLQTVLLVIAACKYVKTLLDYVS